MAWLEITIDTDSKRIESVAAALTAQSGEKNILELKVAENGYVEATGFVTLVWDNPAIR